jgi:hypothetical protein
MEGDVDQEEINKVYAQNLWQLSNLITGFSVAEILVVLLSMPHDSSLRESVNAHRCFSTGATILGQTMLVVAIWWCSSQQKRLLGNFSNEVASTLTTIMFIQIAILIVAGAGFLSAIWNLI